jgi:hypothetical protein
VASLADYGRSDRLADSTIISAFLEVRYGNFKEELTEIGAETTT